MFTLGLQHVLLLFAHCLDHFWTAHCTFLLNLLHQTDPMCVSDLKNTVAGCWLLTCKHISESTHCEFLSSFLHFYTLLQVFYSFFLYFTFILLSYYFNFTICSSYNFCHQAAAVVMLLCQLEFLPRGINKGKSFFILSHLISSHLI